MIKFSNRLFRKKRIKPWQRRPKAFMSRKSHFLKKKKGDSIKFLKAGLLTALIFFIAYFIFFSEIFIIKKIDIKGNKTILKENIEKIIENENENSVLAIFTKNNFFLNDEEKIKEKLLNKFPEIETVTIEKKLPNTIKVQITEKIPIILWCRIKSCYYLNNKGIAFMIENNDAEIYKNKKFIKIIEEEEIKEEIHEINDENKKIGDNESKIKKKEDENNKIENIYSEEQIIEPKEKIVLIPIKINDKIANEDFIGFIIKLDSSIKSITDLKIKYYKTKGVKTRGIIAYTDRNIRIYFNATDDAKLQTTYLKDFMSKGIGKNEINTLEYIYLESGNKIFYK